ncbi:MAG: hypothetical protein HRU09_20285 [Oligoflexales bacterium]|nr:hypothetical protein [Oligoflexales bacterium]
MKSLNRLLLIFILALTHLAAYAAHIDWSSLSSGEHPFRDLGDEYFVPLKMKKIPSNEARVLFFNYKLAEKIKLPFPKAPQQLEKLILDHFAVMVERPYEAHELNTEGSMFATRYMDSAGKNPEKDAMGDGRAVWAGQWPVEDDHGKVYLDVVLKGVGITTLEWIGHSESSHKDGLQSKREAVHSYMIGAINADNQLNASTDLAVIELSKLKKYDEKFGEQAATITVRIGHQTRMGHLSYWSHEAPTGTFKQILNYSVRRALGYHCDRTLGLDDYKLYLAYFVENIADNAARLEDLQALHGSLTRGNMTTS